MAHPASSWTDHSPPRSQIQPRSQDPSGSSPSSPFTHPITQSQPTHQIQQQQHPHDEHGSDRPTSGRGRSGSGTQRQATRYDREDTRSELDVRSRGRSRSGSGYEEACVGERERAGMDHDHTSNYVLAQGTMRREREGGMEGGPGHRYDPVGERDGTRSGYIDVDAEEEQDAHRDADRDARRARERELLRRREWERKDDWERAPHALAPRDVGLEQSETNGQQSTHGRERERVSSANGAHHHPGHTHVHDPEPKDLNGPYEARSRERFTSEGLDPLRLDESPPPKLHVPVTLTLPPPPRGSTTHGDGSEREVHMSKNRREQAETAALEREGLAGNWSEHRKTPSGLYATSDLPRRSSQPSEVYLPGPLAHTRLPTYVYATNATTTKSATDHSDHDREVEQYRSRGREAPVQLPSPPSHPYAREERRAQEREREMDWYRPDVIPRHTGAVPPEYVQRRRREEPIDVDQEHGRREGRRAYAALHRRPSDERDLSSGQIHASPYQQYLSPEHGMYRATQDQDARTRDRGDAHSRSPSRHSRPVVAPIRPQVIHGLPPALQGAPIQAFQPYYPSDAFEDSIRADDWPVQNGSSSHILSRHDRATPMSSSRSGESLPDRSALAYEGTSRRDRSREEREYHERRYENPTRAQPEEWSVASSRPPAHMSTAQALNIARNRFDQEVRHKALRDKQRLEEWEHGKAMMLAQLVMEERRRTALKKGDVPAVAVVTAQRKKQTTRDADRLDDELMGLAEDDASPGPELDELEENGMPESSPAPIDPEQQALLAALEAHEGMNYPTKGMRNKDGTLRKKPGPPKGIKKGQSKRQFLEENAKDRLLGRIKEEDDGSDNPSGSGTAKGKRRRLNPMTSELGSQMGSRQSSPVIKGDASGGGAPEYHGMNGDGPDDSDDEDPGNDMGDEDRDQSRDPQQRRADSAGQRLDPFYSEEPEIDLRPLPPRWRPNPSGFSQPPGVPVALDGREYESPPPDAGIISNNTAYYRADCADRMQWLLWMDIVQKQVPLAYKYVRDTVGNKQDNAKKIAVLCARAPKRQAAREKKTLKDQMLRARKAAREAIAFWRKNEREEIENRKRAEREALEKAKAAEAAKEKEMAARRLNYLLSSGEMYSRLMKKKIRTDEAMESGAGTPDVAAASDMEEEDEEDDDGDEDDIDMDAEGDMTEEAIKRQAARRAKSIMRGAKNKAAAFDKQVMVEREQALGDDAEDGPDKALTTEGLDFQNPLAGENNVAIAQPKMLMATLKDYQLKGLSWLGNLYESGINGILADEMGLGKTIQSISLLAYLAEQHNIWGPFLVVAPASTVHNWQQELTRFVPRLKTLPYWGIEKDRKILRRDWNRKSLTFTEDAPFHIVVTSYEMAVRDEAAFQKVRWQYMILDEAQAVKNATSLRWQTLLTLKTRNRLLLTGTPIQNSMNELWALLHFIMPELFSSLNDFTEWFSKGIEGASGMRDNNLSTKQLKRLHDVLRPFMLRRVKKNVQSELGEKIEIDLVVDLSPRQRSMYRALRTNASVRALLASAVETSDTAAKSKTLMNIVMQFRKVCGHPDLFDRADVASPYSWGTFSGSGELMRQGSLYCPDSCRNPISFKIPRLVWNERKDAPSERSRAGSDTRYLGHLINIWDDGYIARSSGDTDSSFGFLSLTRASPSDVRRQARRPFWQKVFDREEQVKETNEKPWSIGFANLGFQSGTRSISLNAVHATSPAGIAEESWGRSWLSRHEARFYLEKAVSPPVHSTCSSRSFERQRDAAAHDPLSELALYGLLGDAADDGRALHRARGVLPGLPPRGLLGSSPLDQTPTTAMRFPSMKRLIFDSAKLARLDSLLRELKAGGHRVLIYFQMTKMMGIVEEYLIYKQHKYLRLDGSTPIGDRRDLVGAWQTNPELFVFMLSTKAGGLGINLTAADTVIFYDHDWNPSSDSQAMDRAHRVGQTRQVTVYRLICRHTIDERILQLARTKKDVQDIVVGTKTLAEVNSQKEIVSLLLDDDEDAGLGSAGAGSTSFGGAGFGNGFNATNFEDEDDEGFFTTKKGGTKGVEDGPEDAVDGTESPIGGAATGGKGKGKKRKAMADGDAPPPAKKKATKKVKIADEPVDADGNAVSGPKPKKVKTPKVPKAPKVGGKKKAGSPLKQSITDAAPAVDADGDVEMGNGSERMVPLDNA